ncbi:hypothetical protein BHE74_00045690 [Ensete ventricosum]|nr:hypothetical protein BHE74_00045690 [Ensete ventricosum]
MRLPTLESGGEERKISVATATWLGGSNRMWLQDEEIMQRGSTRRRKQGSNGDSGSVGCDSGGYAGGNGEAVAVEGMVGHRWLAVIGGRATGASALGQLLGKGRKKGEGNWSRWRQGSGWVAAQRKVWLGGCDYGWRRNDSAGFVGSKKQRQQGRVVLGLASGWLAAEEEQKAAATTLLYMGGVAERKRATR